MLRKTSTSFVARIGGDATGWSKGRYRFVNNTIITATGSGAVFRLFDELESVEMHNNVIVTNGTGGPNVMRANAAEFMWVNGVNIAGSNNWVMTGATNIPTQWTGTITRRVARAHEPDERSAAGGGQPGRRRGQRQPRRGPPGSRSRTRSGRPAFTRRCAR